MRSLLTKLLAGSLATLVILALITQGATLWLESRIPQNGEILTINGTDVHYMDRGTGQSIVLIHGLSGQMRNFAPALVDRLAVDHRVILLDRPGSGYSAPLARGENTIDGQADVVAGLIAALDLKAPLIVGHSLGGAVALNLALNHPDQIGGLAVIAPASQPRASTSTAFAALGIRSDGLRRFVSLTFATPLGLMIFDSSAKAVFAPEIMPPNFGTASGSLLSIRPQSYFAAGGDMIAIAEALPGMAARYATLEMPVGILFGRSDQVLEPDYHGNLLRDAVADATLTLIDGGHMIVVTAPDQVSSWILEQVTRLEQAGL